MIRTDFLDALYEQKFDLTQKIEQAEIRATGIQSKCCDNMSDINIEREKLEILKEQRVQVCSLIVKYIASHSLD